MDKLTSLFSDSLLSILGSCLPSASIINVNNRSFRVLKILGEGGFSIVYLVRDLDSSKLYAVKKIYCGKGDQESFQIAFREVEITRLFQHPNIIKVLDVCVITQPDDSRLVYIFFDYYEKGSIHDLVSNNFDNKTYLSELDILNLFKPVCYSIKELHHYKLKDIPKMNNCNDVSIQNDLNDEEIDNDLVPYAHRDIKPGNIMLDEDNLPILMDFGSAEKARIQCTTRQAALVEQEKAAKYSTMTFRAPELFEVEPNQLITEKVDIWSLGCLLYSLAYGNSPFDFTTSESGGSTKLAVMNGRYSFPANDPYPERFHQLIGYLLVTDPNKRPDIQQVITKIDEYLSQL